MSKIRKYLEDDTGIPGDPSADKPTKDMIDWMKAHSIKTPSPSGKPYFDEEKINKYLNVVKEYK